MEYIFNVESESLNNFQFGDSGTAHLMICPKHPEVISFG